MGSSFQNNRFQAISEMNVTPLVDVMLVLLIVFMITAPFIQQGISVNLPQTHGTAIPMESEPIIISITASKEIFIDSKRIDQSALTNEVKKKPNHQEVIIQVDQAVRYGFLAHVIADLKKAGIEHVGLATRPISKL
jgi:biopolymer transport protein TolR